MRVLDLQPHPIRTVDIVQGDMAEPDVLDAALEGGIDGVVHLAAVTSVLRSVEHPVLTYRTNVEATAMLLEGARAAGVTVAGVRVHQRRHRADARSGDHRGGGAPAADALRGDQGRGRDADVRLHGFVRSALRGRFG